MAGREDSISFAVLGPLQVHAAGELLTLGRARERALLAFFLTRRGQVAARDEIVEALWADAPPRNPVAALQTAVSRLRAALGPLARHLQTTDLGYVLDAGAGEVDASLAESLLEEASTRGASDAVGLLEAAEALWRGPAYADFRYEEFAQAEIGRLDELQLRLAEERIRLSLALGRHEDLIPELRSLVASHPLHEGMWQWLMLSLYRSGRQAESLRVFQEARAAMIDVGLELNPDLADLELRILSQDPELLEPEARERIRGGESASLPSMLGSFVGRDKEVDDLLLRLDTSRLVTILGPGGVGKTRLAAEVAARVGAAGGVRPLFVALDELAPGGNVGMALASALGVGPGHSKPIQAVADRIGSRRALLVVDGAERLVAGVAEAVQQLAALAPAVRVLVTSRVRLGLAGETVLALGPLATGPSSDAVQLFRDRAGRPSGASDGEAAALTRIVEAVGGLPLLIELAAGRAASIPLSQIAADLEAGTLVAARSGAVGPARHQSLEATVAWSWNLLPPEAQQFFARLAVMRSHYGVGMAAGLGGVTEEKAHEVLLELAEHSLIVPAGHEDDAVEASFRTLEPIRRFALGRLEASGELVEIRERHAESARSYVRQAPTMFADAHPEQWMPRFRRRVPDFEDAFSWLLETSPDKAAELACDLAQFWAKSQEYGRGKWMLETALTRIGGVTRVRARSLILLGTLHVPGRDLGAENVSFSHPFRDWRRRVRMPSDVMRRGREAAAWLRQGADLAAALEDRDLEVLGRMFLGVALGELGDLSGAREQIGLADVAAGPGTRFHAQVRAMVANVAIADGDFERAAGEAQQAHDLIEETGDAFQMIMVLDVLGRLARARGQRDRAADHYERAEVEFARPAGMRPGEALLAAEVGELRAGLGQFDEARRHLADALTIGQRQGMPRIEGKVRRAHALIAGLLGEHASARFHLERALASDGEAESIDGFAQSLSRLGLVAEMVGDLEAADSHHRAALRSFVGWSTPDLALSLEGLAACLLMDGDHEGAARLLGAAEAMRLEVRSPAEPWCSVHATTTKVEEKLGEEAFAEAKTAGSAAGSNAMVAEALA